MATLNPDADDVDGGWTNEAAGTSLFGSVDEVTSANDADYIQSSLSPGLDVCRLRLSNPGGSVNQPMTISTRYKKAGGADAIDLAVRLVQGASTEIAQWTYVGISTSFVTVTETLTSAQFALITDFTDLFIELTASTSLFGVVDSLNGNVVSDPYDGAETGFSASWVAAVVADGGTVSAGRQTLVDTLISGLMADGVWRKLDRLWLFAAENSQSALRDIRKNVLATAFGSPSFTTDRGYTGVDSSTTVYIDTNTNLSNYGGSFMTNSGHISAWSNTNATAGGGGGNIIGQQTGANNAVNILPKDSSGNADFRVNDAGTSSGSANSNSTGHYVANRSDSTHTQGYINGSIFSNPNASAGTIQNRNCFILADNGVSGANFGGGYQVTMASIGAHLSSTDVANFYARLRTYMTAVGVP